MMYEPLTNITADEFIKREYRIWGEEYIDDLIERGYTPIFINDKWTWMIQVSSANYAHSGTVRSDW